MEDENKQIHVQTTISRLNLGKLKEIAFDRDIHLRTLIREILENYAKTQYKPEATPT